MRKSEAELNRLVRDRKARKKRRLKDALYSRNEKLREKLIEERHLVGMSQAQVARRFGRDQSFISRIENGTRMATFVEVERLLRIYDQTIEEFWAGIKHFSLEWTE